ncbi:nucleotide exchange factor GrpE [Gulosibacter chungangensis]|uniref:Protein GrpE n=2 Tax=Gulosibacter chungangensis TaxID=979746 RepID=A0A7J5BGC7_9MICO|nr:nucleotide exchange factor GrpE [Gulosibacter chungangensis]
MGNEQNSGSENPAQHEEPIIRDKRRIDPETGKVREPNQDAAGNDVEDAVADAQADAERETISDEELQNLLNEAMNASTASDLPGEDAASAVEETEDARLARERLDDLRRVQAEYTNYRRRTDREKAELGEVATANVVTQLLPVLDDLGRAEAAGDLPEGSALQVIVAKLYGTIEKLGVESYGEKGEPFDPAIHEAIAQLPNPEVTEHTIADVVQLGYRIGEREIRPAKVAVFVPAE